MVGKPILKIEQRNSGIVGKSNSVYIIYPGGEHSFSVPCKSKKHDRLLLEATVRANAIKRQTLRLV